MSLYQAIIAESHVVGQAGSIQALVLGDELWCLIFRFLIYPLGTGKNSGVL